jgi:hypothetical protein
MFTSRALRKAVCKSHALEYLTEEISKKNIEGAVWLLSTTHNKI